VRRKQLRVGLPESRTFASPGIRSAGKGSKTDMDLKELLSPRKAALLQEWFDRIVSVYPGETQKFLKSQTDPFANPIGHTIRDGIARLYEEILTGGNLLKGKPVLVEILKIRVVQNSSSAEAVAFLSILKDILESAIEEEFRTAYARELRNVEARIDLLTGWGLEVYGECRERISRIRAGEQNRSNSVMERMKSFYARQGKEFRFKDR
jgi:hypothetical protein